MAGASKTKPPLLRQTYAYGTKTIQVGKNKGGVKAGFVAIPSRTAAALGLKLSLPTRVPGTTYTVEDGLIFDSHTTAKGNNVKTPVQGKVGAKKVTVYFPKKGDVEVKKTGGAKGKKATEVSDISSIEIGIPAWGDVPRTQLFLKGSNAISFSFGGGHPYPVKTTGAKA
jgi:hypothetical protein